MKFDWDTCISWCERFGFFVYDLTNFPQIQYMTQGHFIIESHTQIKTHA